MEPAVTAMLDRAIVFPRPYIAGRVWKLVILSEVSNRAGSPLFGCRRSPQRRNPFALFNHLDETCSRGQLVVSAS